MDKYLLVVNRDNHFNESMLNQFEMLPILDEDGETYIEKETLEAFLQMAAYLRDTYDIKLGITSAGRTIETQKAVYEQIKASKGEKYAADHVAPAGASEHHTGLAFDVNVHQVRPKFIKKLIEKNKIIRRYFNKQEIESGKRDEMFHTLHNVMVGYGFILRYPEGKEKITGFNPERWHIRYVGKENAEKITDAGLTLEEYVKRLGFEIHQPNPSTFGE